MGILYAHITSAVTIDNTNQVFDLGGFNTSISTNQTYNSIDLGAGYINFSYNSSNYIIYNTPVISGTEYRLLFTESGTYFDYTTFSGKTLIVVINGTNQSMTTVPGYFYYNTSLLGDGSYTATRFYIQDSIGLKSIDLETPLTIDVSGIPETIVINPSEWLDDGFAASLFQSANSTFRIVLIGIIICVLIRAILGYEGKYFRFSIFDLLVIAIAIIVISVIFQVMGMVGSEIAKVQI